MTVTFWLWLALVGLAAGGAAILFVAKRRTAGEETNGIVHGIVPVIAATSYFAMVCGQGSIVLPLGADPAAAQTTFYFARYVDWMFTTPILLFGLAATAMHSGLRRHGAVFGLIVADVLMLATALFFGFSTTPWIKWTWYAISSGAFLAVYYVIWGVLKQESMKEREDVQSTFTRSATIISVVWSFYPLVLLVGTDGLKLVGPVVTTAAIVLLDFAAKIFSGLVAVTSRAKLVDRDLREQHGATGTGPRRASRPAAVA